METNKKIIIRKAIKELSEIGDKLELPRDGYVLSSVRATAVTLKADTGNCYTVNATKDRIVVTRVEPS